MNRDEQFTEWAQRRSQVIVPIEFVSRVMQSLDRELARRAAACPPRSAWLSALTLAAGVLLVLLGHAGTIGLCLFAMTGVAR